MGSMYSNVNTKPSSFVAQIQLGGFGFQEEVLWLLVSKKEPHLR